MTVWLDMDGVLADFDLGYEHLTGERLVLDKTDVDWALVDEIRGFFFALRPLPDAYMLEHFVREWSQGDYGVITALPKTNTADVAADKRAWLDCNFPRIPRVRFTSPGEEKAQYCRPGDVLIDDWPSKHKAKWISAGGRFIHHTSAASSIRQLREPFSVN